MFSSLAFLFFLLLLPPSFLVLPFICLPSSPPAVPVLSPMTGSAAVSAEKAPPSPLPAIVPSHRLTPSPLASVRFLFLLPPPPAVPVPSPMTGSAAASAENAPPSPLPVIVITPLPHPRHPIISHPQSSTSPHPSSFDFRLSSFIFHFSFFLLSPLSPLISHPLDKSL